MILQFYFQRGYILTPRKRFRVDTVPNYAAISLADNSMDYLFVVDHSPKLVEDVPNQSDPPRSWKLELNIELHPSYGGTSNDETKLARAFSEINDVCMVFFLNFSTSNLVHAVYLVKDKNSYLQRYVHRFAMFIDRKRTPSS